MKTSMQSVILLCNYATGDLKHHNQEKSLPCLSFKVEKNFSTPENLTKKIHGCQITSSNPH